MLPAKYQPNPPGGSGEEDFSLVFTIYGHGGHLEFRIKTILAIFRSPSAWMVHMHTCDTSRIIQEAPGNGLTSRAPGKDTKPPEVEYSYNKFVFFRTVHFLRIYTVLT